VYDPEVTANYPPNGGRRGNVNKSCGHKPINFQKKPTQISLPLYDPELTANYPPNGGRRGNFNKSCGHKPINFKKNKIPYERPYSIEGMSVGVLRKQHKTKNIFSQR